MRAGFYWSVATFILCCGEAWSDDIYLKDGSHIVGSVTGVVNGKLVVTTEFAGKISIVLDAILRLETEKQTGFKLDTGDIFSGRLQFDDAQ